MPKENNPTYFDDLSYAVEAIYKKYILIEVCLLGVCCFLKNFFLSTTINL